MIVKPKHLLLILAVWGSLFGALNPVFAQTWTQTSAPSGADAVASSADGTKLVAVVNNWIYVSTNSGTSWTSNSVPLGPFFKSVTSSADGTKLVTASIVVGICGIYTSTNSGVSWQQTSAPTNYGWNAVASSADGTKLVAVGSPADTYVGPIYTSMDSGTTWVSNSAPILAWNAVASSADGTKLVAAGSSQPAIYTSTNSGTTWVSNCIPDLLSEYGLYWQSVASSADGTKLVAAEEIGWIYTSTTSGMTWTSNNTPGLNLSWQSVASSADGTKLVAAEEYGVIYTSVNSGTTWTSNSVPLGYWSSVASSADGSKLVAATWAYGALADAYGIYTLDSTPAPSLNIAPSDSNLVLSWIMPSTNFVLQQNLDLTTTNWTDVTDTPTLNLCNLQYQVGLSPTNSSGFYRLATP
jgi:hypothetical protein